MPFVYLHDAFVPAEDARISILERGFRFGDGIFDTIRLVQAIPYQWELHLARINQGLQALRIPFDSKELYNKIQQLIIKNSVYDGFIRLSISRGIGSQGYLPTGNTPTLVIETTPPATVPATPVSLYLSQYRKPSPEALPVACKLMQGVNSTLARMEAADHGCFEALQLNASGHLCEGSSSNIFWVKDKVLYTPSLDQGILAGTMRAAVIRLSPSEVKEGAFPLYALQTADEVFMTNTSWLALPVASLETGTERFTWQTFDTAHRLRQLIEEDMAFYATHNIS